VLDLLFSRSHSDFQQARKREIGILNKFYQKSSEKISPVLPDGSFATAEKKEYCKIPKIEFKASENMRTFEKEAEGARYK
jgi:hypothetical protein